MTCALSGADRLQAQPPAFQHKIGVLEVQKQSIKQPRTDYEVGRGRPPKHTRWKSGQSGNPNGRPAGSRNILAIFKDALEQKIKIEEGGKTRMITAREGIVKRLVNLALKGDSKATAYVIAIESEIFRYTEPSKTKLPADTSTEEVIKTYLKMVKQVR
jgi:hypothetical protein